MKPRRARETFACPVCGQDVPVDAPGCRECGSTMETGWSPDTEYDGLDLPDPDEDEAVDEPRRYPLWVVALTAILIFLMVILAVR